MSKYDWLEKRTLRSVDQLRLWSDNPRLDPEDNHVNLADYVSDLIAETGEKDSFMKLIVSITSDGYIPGDPVVVWQNIENERYYVAEGNRRVLAIKLLRHPDKAPKSIRGFIKKNADLIDRNTIEKIKVCVAPSFEACEWYINQRHASSSIQQPWSRLQQQRWIAELYDKYKGDIDKIKSITRLNKGQLEYTLRILKIRDLALNSVVLNSLNADEQNKVKSHRIPMTILERWFTNPVVKEKWGLEFSGDNINITSNMQSFLSAYAILIKYIIHRDEPDVEVQINTRTITSNLDDLLKSLPEVSFENSDESEDSVDEPINDDSSDDLTNEQNTNESSAENKSKATPPLNKNPDRNNLVVSSCQLKTGNYKLDALFREFKQLPLSRYKNCIAASLRVFLDISISEYIIGENCVDDMKTIYKRDFYDIPLKSRLEYLKQHKLTAKTPSYKVVEKLLNHTNDYSLDTLNNYVHGNNTHHTGKRFLNGFWDFLYPLFVNIMDIKDQ